MMPYAGQGERRCQGYVANVCGVSNQLPDSFSGGKHSASIIPLRGLSLLALGIPTETSACIGRSFTGRSFTGRAAVTPALPPFTRHFFFFCSKAGAIDRLYLGPVERGCDNQPPTRTSKPKHTSRPPTNIVSLNRNNTKL